MRLIYFVPASIFASADPIATRTAGTPVQSKLSGLCLDLPGGNASNGALLGMWECSNGETQHWAFRDDQLMYGPDTTKCVDLISGTTNGNQLGLWDCNGGHSQQWRFDSDAGTVYFKSFDGTSKCFQIHEKNQGDPIEIWDCNGEERQTWQVGLPDTVEPINDNGSLCQGCIRSEYYDLCMDLPGGDTTNGVRIWMWECSDGNQHQQWSFQNGNLVYMKDQSKCVDLIGGDSSLGHTLGIWDCNDRDSQKWQYEPEIESIAMQNSGSQTSKCIQNRGDGDQGDEVEIWDCNGAGRQFWQISANIFGLFLA